MSTTTGPTTVRNGVPVDKLFGTIGKVEEQPELAAFALTARNRWVQGTGRRPRSTSCMRWPLV